MLNLSDPFSRRGRVARRGQPGAHLPAASRSRCPRRHCLTPRTGAAVPESQVRGARRGASAWSVCHARLDGDLEKKLKRLLCAFAANDADTRLPAQRARARRLLHSRANLLIKSGPAPGCLSSCVDEDLEYTGTDERWAALLRRGAQTAGLRIIYFDAGGPDDSQAVVATPLRALASAPKSGARRPIQRATAPAGRPAGGFRG